MDILECSKQEMDVLEEYGIIPVEEVKKNETDNICYFWTVMASSCRTEKLLKVRRIQENGTTNRFPWYKILESASACIFLNELKNLAKIQLENTSSLNSSISLAYQKSTVFFCCYLSLILPQAMKFTKAKDAHLKV